MKTDYNTLIEFSLIFLSFSKKIGIYKRIDVNTDKVKYYFLGGGNPPFTPTEYFRFLKK